MQESKPGILYRIPFYPLLLGVYPVLYLWLANVFQVPAALVLRPLLISSALSGMVWGITWLAVRRMRKAAAVAGLFLGMFFIYGRVYDLIYQMQIFGVVIDRHRYVMLAWIVLFIGLTIVILRWRSQLFALTWIANLVTSFLLLLTVSQLAYALVRSYLIEDPAQASLATLQPAALNPATLNPQADTHTPDVYYILMDGYDREDLLMQDIGVSNHAFISQLQQLGFVVPTCTQSNYNSTVFSVASAFNMNYLDTLGFSYEELSQADYGVEFSTPQLEAFIHSNPVMKQFQSMGYQVITFHQAYPFINFPNSDIVLSTPEDGKTKVESTKFQYMFWKTTALDLLIEEKIDRATAEELKSLPDWVQQALSDNFSLYQQYEQNLDQLSQLDHITEIPGKKFVYAHLMVTHPDFAFTASGQFRDNSTETKAAYGDQVAYVDQRILAIVKNILASSKTPPIIILQGDHGYGYGGRGVEQFKILNAYYLPQGGSSAVYPSITPVNSFRLILTRYFGQNYPVLPDQSIWIHSDFPNGYQFEPGTCESQNN
jgi:hypothetical protein